MPILPTLGVSKNLYFNGFFKGFEPATFSVRDCPAMKVINMVYV